MRKSYETVRPKRTAATTFSTFGVLILGILLTVGFTIALPDTFPTALTFQSILNNQSTVLLLALGLTVVIATKEFDLSIGYGTGLMYVLTIGLMVKQSVPWGLSVAIVIVLGTALGLINGLLVHLAHIDSFIATLGTGTICYGISLWYTGGQQIIAPLPAGFKSLAGQFDLGIPQPAVIAIALAIVLLVVLQLTPAGRYFYALGFNRKAAELSGIPVRKYGIAAFAISGFIVGIAGVLLASRLQVAASNTGPEFLLPAFVGALLGKTTIRPGRPNVLGTVLAVIVLAIGISGLEQLGGQYYVENLFNGFTLIIAVGLAGYVARRRTGVKPVPTPGDEPVPESVGTPTPPEPRTPPKENQGDSNE